jgi:phage antirepressor YoqD-like protein
LSNITTIASGAPARTMSSIELLELVNQARAEFGESEVRRNDFTARCRDELEGEYYETFVVSNPRGPASEALKMTRDQCMYVLMRESKAVRRAVTVKLNEGAAAPVALPNVRQLAQMVIKAEDARELAEAERDEAIRTKALIGSKREATAMATASAAKREASKLREELGACARHATITAVQIATGTQTFRQVAKLLQAKEPAFRAFLAARRILYQIGGTWTPYAEHIDAGRFVVKTGSAENGHSFSATRFTPKGVAWVSALWLDAIGKD